MNHREIRWNGYGLASSSLQYGSLVNPYEHGSEPSGSIKVWEFLE
jgi:hypothetical protein